MNRQKFMKELESLLYTLSEEERTDALRYYNDYFDEAGPEREQEIIRELISPEFVARTIMDGMREQKNSFDDQSWQNRQYRDGYSDYRTDGGYNYDWQDKEKKKSFQMPVWGWLLLLLTAPVTVPLLFSVISAIFGIMTGIVGVIMGFFVAGIGLGIGAVALFLAGFKGFGCLCLGAGFLLESIVCLLIPFVLWMIRSMIPGIFRFLRRQVRRIFYGGGDVA